MANNGITANIPGCIVAFLFFDSEYCGGNLNDFVHTRANANVGLCIRRVSK